MISRYQAQHARLELPAHRVKSGRIGGLAYAALIPAIVATYFGLGRLAAHSSQTAVRTFQAQGVIQALEPESQTIVISHQAIPEYMEAMTMPFRLLEAKEITGLQVGDQISFRLSVTDTRSWIDQIVKLANQGPAQVRPKQQASASSQPIASHHPLLDYTFTNELGQPVTIHSFAGQVLAITFFFTRCPVPDFCPRLSRNFAEASRKLESLPDPPTNWHFLSITFDPEFDTPSVLKVYAEKYQYDPAHWSFLTGPKDKIGELARLSNMEVQPESGLFNHNFRTMVIDGAGRLQMVFPTGGDLSEAIVSEVLKAAAGSHRTK